MDKDSLSFGRRGNDPNLCLSPFRSCYLSGSSEGKPTDVVFYKVGRIAFSINQIYNIKLKNIGKAYLSLTVNKFNQFWSHSKIKIQ